jgi:hypothetical protein
MTIVIRDPTWRQRLARNYRKTRQAAQRREREREQLAAEYAAYESRQPELIKRDGRTHDRHARQKVAEKTALYKR